MCLSTRWAVPFSEVVASICLFIGHELVLQTLLAHLFQARPHAGLSVKRILFVHLSVSSFQSIFYLSPCSSEAHFESFASWPRKSREVK